MEQQADYIRRIEIKGLWGRFNIQWDLRPDVNILSGRQEREVRTGLATVSVAAPLSRLSGQYRQ